MKKTITTMLILLLLTGCNIQQPSTTLADSSSSSTSTSSTSHLSFSESEPEEVESLADDSSDITASSGPVEMVEPDIVDEPQPVAEHQPTQLLVVDPTESTELENPTVTVQYSQPSVPAETPQPIPIPEPTPQPTPQPTQAPTPEPTPQPVPPFDVNTWVQFGVNFGTGLGMTFDTSVTGSWDNPIVASAGSLYLERDISGMLTWYQLSGLTKFNIWAEDIGGGRYNIYISYA